MRLICVGGALSGCGKTAVACLLLKTLPGWAAVKVTPCHPGESCPFECECGACEPPESSYEVITDPTVLAEYGKDTARFLEAGAAGAAWVRSLSESLPEALESALSNFPDTPGVIIESTSAIPLIEGLRILVMPEGKPNLKDSAQACVDVVDILAVNARGNVITGEPAQVLRQAQDGPSQTASGARIPRTIGMCALLPPDDPVNQEFIAVCRQYLESK